MGNKKSNSYCKLGCFTLFTRCCKIINIKKAAKQAISQKFCGLLISSVVSKNENLNIVIACGEK